MHHENERKDRDRQRDHNSTSRLLPGSQTRDDDRNRNGAPSYPALLAVAGWMWIALGALFLSATIFNLTRIHFADHEAGAQIGFSFYLAILVLAFGRAGYQSIKGVAEDVIGQAHLSVALSVACAGFAVWAIIDGRFRGLILFSANGAALLTSGMFAIRSRARYLEWKAFR